ncbi:MAG: hypothetical protein SFY70_06515 [Bacteroidia bacterium]|nr:hypothetical protein [Bacteroidia bacterium]
MRLRLSTRVAGNYRTVMAGFTQALFVALAPPLPKVQLRRFDGSETGDEVHLDIDFVFFRQRWHSTIVQHGDIGTEAFFVDEGTVLPFFLARWQHHHRVVADGPAASIIEDDIRYSSGTWLGDVLLYPGLWLQFAYRKPVYRRFFARRA